MTVVPAIEYLGVSHLRKLFAWDWWQIVGIVHLKDFGQLTATAHLARVASTHNITLPMTALVSIVEPRCAVAVDTTPETEERCAGYSRAKVVANLWGHLLTVLLWHMLGVPNLLRLLCIEYAAYPPECGWPPVGLDGVWHRK
jgi:hypothetical protein